MFTEASDIKPFQKRLWLSSPTMHGEELAYMTEAFQTNWMSTLGKNIDAAERMICEKTGRRYAVGLSSGTAALHLAVKLAGVKPGDRVFCSDMTFSATLNPVVYEGGIPVFIDTERDTWNMDPAALEKAFERYPEVKAVVAANLYGTPGKLGEIRAICGEHGAFLIEDAAESLGAVYRGMQTGTFGDCGCISFNGNKIVTGSCGGMLLTDDKKAADRVRKWSTQSRENAPWYQHEELGYNYRMSNVTAGIGRGQLLHLAEHKAKKKEIYRQYQEAFADIPEITMNPLNPEGDANCWLSCMTIKEGCAVTPDMVMDALEGINAESRPIWKPMHLQPFFAKEDFISHYEDGRSVGEDVFARGLCLPSDIKNTDEDMELIVRTVKECFRDGSN